LWLHFI